MPQYKAYNKRAIEAVMKYREGLHGNGTAQSFTPTKQPAWWDVTKWGQWWETGAKEVEKSAPGKLLTAPIRLPAAVISATTKTIEKIPGIVGNVGKVIPIIAVGAVVVGGVILWSKFSKGKKIAV
jgi:hypothetical protein